MSYTAKLRWALEIIETSRIKPNPRIMNYVDVKTGYVFSESLAKRTRELRETIERFASTIWPVIVKKEDFVLVDGYCRYTTLKAMSVSKIYAYVGTL